MNDENTETNKPLNNDGPILAWTVSNFCKAADVSPSSVWKYVSLGKLKVVRFGGSTRIPNTEVERFLREGIR